MERRSVIVRGVVQGVGLRPYIYGLAQRHHLRGSVRNQSGSVLIEIEGEGDALDGFLSALEDRPPPLAHIEDVTWLAEAPRGDALFRIEPSSSSAAEFDGSRAEVYVSPDVATCDECLQELFDSSDRRYRYPFLNCTHCGPRLSIVHDAPYDRERTTMKRFRLCPRCRGEYDDPRDRRFHAQPTACAACGPRLELVPTKQLSAECAALCAGQDPLTALVAVLKQGGIAAIKGLGGYHLACDARNAATVAELRRRKRRDEKPFAVMVADAAAAERLCRVAPEERRLLTSPRRPIVLLKRRASPVCDELAAVCDEVAPGNPCLGVMLPYTPLHHLLMRALGDGVLVMTSGNCADEPIAYGDDDALRRLGGIADPLLRHDRPIHVRCDDSITRWVAGAELPIRRARGYAPQSIRLPLGDMVSTLAVPALAVGGQLKGAFALGVRNRATVSHHLGDLDHFSAYQQFKRDIPLYERLFRVAPRLLVHDLHPDYASTRYAIARAGRESLGLLAVQHHHAHLASCMAEHGLAGPVIGVILDGTGFGLDERTGQPVVWGGEFLVGDYAGFRRGAHLRYVPMPGGDKAAQEPWRMAISHLTDAGCDMVQLNRRIPAASRRTIDSMLARRFQSPLTSSAGRLFDAVAAIAGVRDVNTFEGQAAMQLEWLAAAESPDGAYPFEISAPDDSGYPSVIDTRGLIEAAALDAARDVSAGRIARRFHSTLVEMIRAVCLQLRDQHGLERVVLSGGVFMNALLLTEVVASLSAAGFAVFRHQQVPPNDGGLCLGQLAVAAAMDSREIVESAAENAQNRLTSLFSSHESGRKPCA